MEQRHGYMSDPYRIVSTTRFVDDQGFYHTEAENRPEKKNKVSILAA
jgi:hypothetical protein